MNKENTNLLNKLPFKTAKSVKDIVFLIKSLLNKRPIAEFGITKVDGVSLERTRRTANQAAIDLLNSLPDDFDGKNLTDEQRSVLSKYTGLGGLSSMNSDLGVADSTSGGAEFEYYTPPELAGGMWDMLLENGAVGGHFLEPSAGTGVFQEMKPQGVLFTSAEIDKTSGRINKLLHPEDDVSISPFERVAVNTPDDYMDGFIGNVPFGISRGMESDLDPAYKNEKQVGAYILLRAIDKVKPNGLCAVIVPTGMTDSAKWKKLREKVSRKAEFLGAHRMPSGTFSENGTSVVTDVWLLKKHPEYLSDQIKKGEVTDKFLSETNVLWETFIRGKWFALDGKRFIYGDVETVGSKGFKRMVVKNDQIKGSIREKLAIKFKSRIDWDKLNLNETIPATIQDGDKRFIGGVWYVMENGVLIPDDTLYSQELDSAVYGVNSYQQISALFLSTASLINTDFSKIQKIATDYPEQIPPNIKAIIDFSRAQPQSIRDKVFKGSLIGEQINILQDKIALYPDQDFDDERKEVAELIEAELQKGNNPNGGRKAKVSIDGAKNWLAFKNSVNSAGGLSDFMKGEIEENVRYELDTTDAEAVVRHLFNQITLDPITVSAFKEVYQGSLPEDEDQALNILATIDGLAITPEGFILPMDRATSGDVSILLDNVTKGMIEAKSPAIKENFQKQFELIQQKRKWTKPDDITFSMDDRWLDRRLILEFLQEQGFDDLVYVKDVQVENGLLTSDLSYSGNDGVFTGYRYKTVMSKNKETGELEAVYKRVRGKDGFSDQFENYLNGVKPRGVNAAEYLERIDRLNESFNTWIRQRDEIDDLVNEWNTKFNAFIDYDHSDAPLGLNSLSGKVVPFGYQNSEVRRLSEDGKGIMGFGTGLGKTPTACALEAFNYENGRVRKTAFVVPKSTIEKWYHEQEKFYSKEAFSRFLFIGLDPIIDADGNPVKIPVLDEEGNQKLNKITGEPELKTALKEATASTIKERLNSIPQTNYRAIVFTKEQYASIPLRPETIEERAMDVLFAMAQAERVNLDGQKHRDAQKRNKIKSDASDTGTTKNNDIPYFEDMGIDNVIVDEGHNYRNSYSAGREASMLAYLPTSPVAKSARDMAVKNAYLLNKNGGRGAYMLTATPLVNSPLDAFNMLSHVVTAEDWQKMGIYTPDDFVKVFGLTETTSVMKITGEIEEKLALVGFKNLGGLRGIFHRYTSMKTLKDVSDEVKIPDIKPVTEVIPMTEYQASEYEALRKRAEDLSKDIETDKEGGISLGNKDSIFSIIRDMDRLVTDPDMYRRQITFAFPISRLEAIKSIAKEIESEGREERKGSKDNEQILVADPQVKETSEKVILTVNDLFEKDVIKRLSKFDIEENEITHFIPPKYSKLIDNLKERMSKGKQIIFIDEKTQHNKLRRIIANALDIDINQIGILNADTVADAGKSGSKVKLKPVKEPDLPSEEATDAQLKAYFEKKAKYDEYIGTLSDMDVGGLESIAADYQEGRTPFIICNKKAEVGIDLHHGTVAIHHLTMPWTPASIVQREGRGARVGSTADMVESIFYCGQGSFDEFRVGTLQRKKNWIAEIMNSDQATMNNADADSQKEMRLLLAANPEEREQMFVEYEQNKKREEFEKGRKRALINLNAYLKSGHANTTPIETAEKLISDKKQALEEANNKITVLESQISDINYDIARYSVDAQEEKETGAYMKWSTGKLKNANSRLRAKNTELQEAKKNLNSVTRQLSAAENFLKRINKSNAALKRLKPEIEYAIKNGFLDIDQNIVDHPENFWISGGKNIRKGGYYHVDANVDYRTIKLVGKLISIDVESDSCVIQPVWVDPVYTNRLARDIPNISVPIEELGEETDLSIPDLELEESVKAGIYYSDISGGKLTKEQFSYFAERRTLYIKGNGAVYRKSDGNFDTEIVRNTPSFNKSYVYPDSTDIALKKSIASAYRSGSNVKKATDFLIAVFGNNYIDEINDLGEVADQATIAEIVDSYIEKGIKEYDNSWRGKSSNFNGDKLEQIKAFIRYGDADYGGIASKIVEHAFPNETYENTGDYKNVIDFSNYYQAKRKGLIDLIKENTAESSKSHAVNELALYKNKVLVSQGDLERLNKLTGDKFTGFYLGDSSNPSGYKITDLYADATALNLISEKAITEASFYDYGRMQSQLNEIDSNFKTHVAEQKKVEDVVSDEVVAQAKENINNQLNDNSVIDSVSDELTIKLNTDVLVTRKFRFNVGECWCIRDDQGKDGALYASKEALKSKYDAKWYNVFKGDLPMKGGWWLVPSTYDIKDVIETINAYK